MEKSDTQPHSQLPLHKETSIRLFGKEFATSDPTIIIINGSSSAAAAATTVTHHETKENRETKRVFECHYCIRNFSTSQALGGHQNAHRRERLQAKRTHIDQSITIRRSSPKPQLHAYPNHHNRPITATASPPYHHHSGTRSSINHNNSVKFYGEKASYTSDQTPSYSRPMAAPSRFPTAVQKLTTFNRGGLLNYSNTGSSSPCLYVHESKPSFNDQVSLDLHL